MSASGEQAHEPSHICLKPESTAASRALQVTPHTCLESGPGSKDCSKAYCPDDDVQHFCATCDRWYHIDCMRRERWGPWSAKEVREEFGEAATDLVERVTPVDRHKDKLRETLTSSTTHPRKKTRASNPAPDFPPEIRAVAQMQILRGTEPGAKYGVVSNGKLVCGARLLLEDSTGGQSIHKSRLRSEWLRRLRRSRSRIPLTTMYAEIAPLSSSSVAR